MTASQYQLWLAVWNASLYKGLSGAQALEKANEAVSNMKE